MWEIIKQDPVAYILIIVAGVSYVGVFLAMARLCWLIGKLTSLDGEEEKDG